MTSRKGNSLSPWSPVPPEPLSQELNMLPSLGGGKMKRKQPNFRLGAPFGQTDRLSSKVHEEWRLCVRKVQQTNICHRLENETRSPTMQ